MNPGAVARNYIQVILREQDGLKALILDDETARVVGLLFTHADLLKHEVILIEKLLSKRTTKMSHITAIFFIRPTSQNVNALRLELLDPHYDSYKLYFSNLARRSFIEEVAYADEEALVSDVREIYADFYAIGRHLLSFEVDPCLDGRASRAEPLQKLQLERTIDCIAATLLALKRKPLIRFHAGSPLCRSIAERVCVKLDQENALFEFRASQKAPLLLILDRREDPVTPLLNQWTYEAMVHELIGIQCNRVSLRNAPNIPDGYHELVLDVDDDFYNQNRYCNFGDLGMNLKTLVDSFQKQSRNGNNLKSIEDMMKFVVGYPEFRRTSSRVSKHVILTAELSRLVDQLNLLEVSEVEQDIACREAEAEHRKRIMSLLQKPNVSSSDKLRLVMLYSLRYEETSDKGLPLMKDTLLKCGIRPDEIHLITAVKEYAGASKRSADVFSNRSFFAMASSKVRRGIGGVDNVYTQHEPLLVYILDDLFRNKMKQTDFPLAQAEETQSCEGLRDGSTGEITVPPPREVLVLIAGGATYEESKCVSALNDAPNGFVPAEGSKTASAATATRQACADVLLMGACVHNSTSFAVEITRMTESQRRSDTPF